MRTNNYNCCSTGGEMYWSRHMVATILQPDFDLSAYPNDEQSIVLTFESYGLTQGVMGLTFADPPIGYVKDINQEIVLSKNPVRHENTCSQVCTC
jgi:hypothetical protein